MKLHIIGICGTFMGGVARLARDLGHRVSGSDAHTYPPMSSQLETLGIELQQGYRVDNIPQDVDIVLVGNAISRGNVELEHVLERGLPYTSGAQWLGENVLQGRWVLAVSGTHGKTTTSSMLAWILHDNQLAPGYLIGGVPDNFGESARLGDTPFFVIEADEYDTAFSDKRSKFIHYRPRTLVVNNLEFDHADIFADLNAIQNQFAHLIKTIPEQGKIIHNQQSTAIDEVLERGCWSESSGFNTPKSDWFASKDSPDASTFTVHHQGQSQQVNWQLIGEHNMSNALAAIAAAHHVGISIAHAAQSLTEFKSVKRRLETLYASPQTVVYDDFAHHPTAITETLRALRNKVGEQPIIAVLEPRSNTMKRGVHKHALADSLKLADYVYLFADKTVEWDVSSLNSDNIQTFADTQKLLDALLLQSPPQPATCWHIVIMSNGSFENLAQRLVQTLSHG